MNLLENERVDDLQYEGLKLIQNKNGFCFGVDSVLLADFAKEIKRNSVIVDRNYWFVVVQKNEFAKNLWCGNPKKCG